MRILHIDESFHTQYGYHTAPIAAEQAKEGHEVIVLTVPASNLYPVFKDFGDNTPENEILTYDKEYENKYGVKIIRWPIYGYVSYRAIYKESIFKEIYRLQPDVILCHNSDSYIAIRMILRNNHFPVVYDSHMLKMASKNKLAKIYRFIYKNFISTVIKKKRAIVIRTQDDPYVIDMGVPLEQSPFISFGTNTDFFYADNTIKNKIRDKMGIPRDAFVIVYTGKLTEEKGGLLFANTIREKFITKNYSDVIFLIVGNTSGSYGKKIDEIFGRSKNIIIRYPIQKYNNLPQFYQVADLSVFPKQCSMSFYDAQACGLPVLSEDNLVNKERCSHGNGMNFKSGSIEDFRNQIQYFIDLPIIKFKKYKDNSIQYIKNEFDYSIITKKYTKILFEECFKKRK